MRQKESPDFLSLPAPNLSALLNGTVSLVRPGLSFTNEFNNEQVFNSFNSRVA